jgi:hypothetical protein
MFTVVPIQSRPERCSRPLACYLHLSSGFGRVYVCADYYSGALYNTTLPRDGINGPEIHVLGIVFESTPDARHPVRAVTIKQTRAINSGRLRLPLPAPTEQT